MKPILEYLENRIQALVEKSIAIVPGTQTRSLTIAIIHSIRDQIAEAVLHDEEIPNVYTIRVNPQDYILVEVEDFWLNSLRGIIQDSMNESNITLAGNLSIELIPSPELSSQKFEIHSCTVRSVIEQTAALKTNKLKKPAQVPQSNKRYYLWYDEQSIPLERGMFQIGRRKDNHLVIEHPTISRSHAQIRKIDGHYVIFDLNSTSGTFLNGIKIRQASLNPGDVITLAGFSLIFIEEGSAVNLDHEKTSKIPRNIDPS